MGPPRHRTHPPRRILSRGGGAKQFASRCRSAGDATQASRHAAHVERAWDGIARGAASQPAGNEPLRRAGPGRFPSASQGPTPLARFGDRAERHFAGWRGGWRATASPQFAESPAAGRPTIPPGALLAGGWVALVPLWAGDASGGRGSILRASMGHSGLPATCSRIPPAVFRSVRPHVASAGPLSLAGCSALIVPPPWWPRPRVPFLCEVACSVLAGTAQPRHPHLHPPSYVPPQRVPPKCLHNGCDARVRIRSRWPRCRRLAARTGEGPCYA